jgi:hypothetical protein
MRTDETASKIDNTANRIDNTASKINEATVRIDKTTNKIDERTRRIDEMTEKIGDIIVRQFSGSRLGDWKLRLLPGCNRSRDTRKVRSRPQRRISSWSS